MKKLLLLSFKNIKSYKKFYIKLTAAFACLVLIICLFSAYAISLSQTQENTKNMSFSANYIVTPLEIEPRYLSETTEKSVFKYYDFSGRTEELFGIQLDSLSPSLISIEYESHKYFSDDQNFSINFYAGNASSLFTENDNRELNLKNSNKSFVTGELPKAKNEILISEDLTRLFGLDEDILGKEISIASKRYPEKKLLDAVVISGIISGNYYELTGHRDTSPFAPVIFMRRESDLFMDTDNIQNTFRYAFSDWLSENEVNALQDKFDASYAGSYVMQNIKDISAMQTITVKIFAIIGSALFFGLILTALLLIEKLAAIFSRNSGILLTCGITRRELRGLLYIQMLWASLFAVIIALALTLGIFAVVNRFVMQVYYVNLNISLLLVMALFGVSVLTVLIINTLFYIHILLKIRKNTVKEFLTTNVI